jgi:hypothetical protein
LSFPKRTEKKGKNHKKKPLELCPAPEMVQDVGDSITISVVNVHFSSTMTVWAS